MKMTIKQRCKEAGISINTYYSRIRAGMSPEEALSTPVKNSIRRRCKEAGISHVAYYARLRAGMTPEEALSKPTNYGKHIANTHAASDPTMNETKGMYNMDKKMYNAVSGKRPVTFWANSPHSKLV